jgi:hypothetical protein
MIAGLSLVHGTKLSEVKMEQGIEHPNWAITFCVFFHKITNID